MKTRVLGPTLLAAGVLVGASLTPRLITAWPAISKAIGRLARSAMTPEVRPIVLAAVLGFLLVTSVVLILKGLWSRRRRSHTNRRVRRVAKLERSGYSLDTIARQTGMAQDAVRMLLASSLRR